jgi:hypothetical protein
MKYIFCFIICIFCFSSEAKEYHLILLENGYLHIGNGKIMETATVGIEDDKIIFVRNTLAFTYDKSDWDTIIDLKGQHIYPGFFSTNTTLGLTEIDAVRATNDFREVGLLNPHIRAQTAFNVESTVISTVRTNGVLLAQPTPRGGRISGTSSIMQLDGWNWEDATILNDDGVHINWPSTNLRGDFEDKSVDKRNEKYELQKQELYNFFDLAKAYLEKEVKTTEDIRLKAMSNCFTGTKRVYFHANDIQQLLDVIDFVKKYRLPYPVIVGGYDSYLITPQLRDARIPIMLLRLHSLPELDEDDVNLPYKLPYLLREGNVKFCLQNEGDMEAMNVRNLPFLAGTAMAYGLTEEEAIQSITLSPCEIVGIDENYGTITEGKIATLFVSKGSALDMRTNQVTVALVNGKFISLDNHQTELNKKYRKKYKLK